MSASTWDPQSAPVLRPPAHQVSRKAIPFWTARAALGWLVVAAVQVVWMVFWDKGPAAPHVVGLIVTAAVAILHLAVMPQWRYRVHRYEITPDVVYTQSGWFNIERRVAPISRIQTVDTKRGPLQQLFGLTDVTVTTASAKGPVEVNGLVAADAERLVAELSSYTRASTGDAT
ncbi:PH domain-containing protein [Pseudonocardia sp. GCM10023141]|uniref:PH domain-containing protein n=1 Tax=Pseudonocardia sp. GCM10023141 TaxID=3252653 RepID=UPI0036133841